MADNEFLTLEEFLSDDLTPKVFESKIWKRKDGTPGKLKFRPATVGDREFARRAAKKGDNFDNAAYGVALIGKCLLEPKIPEIEIEKLRQKNGTEMDRLLTAILGESDSDPT